MNILRIILQRKTDASWPIVAMDDRKNGGVSQRSEGTLTLDMENLRSYSLPKEYGEQLGRALFQDKIRDAYSRALAHARDGNKTPEEKPCLRVLLTVEDLELRALHWERLCAPIHGDWDFIALNQDTPFSIDLPLQTDRYFSPIGKRDLSALALIAFPQDLNGSFGFPPEEPGTVTRTVSMMRGAFGSIPCDILANPDMTVDGNRPVPGRVVGPPTLNALCERLTAGSYTILHVLCHGKTDREGETILFLPGENGRPITGSKLIEHLQRVQGRLGLPQFIFLTACEGGSPEAENGLGGLAQRLVRELGIPAVLAMTDPVSIDTANSLARLFYQHLSDHGEPDLALVQTLAGLQDCPDVTVPVIFSRLGGHPLFNDSIDRKLSAADIQFGADRLVDLIHTHAPVLELETKALAERLVKLSQAGEQSKLAENDREEVLKKANQLCRDIFDIPFNALALDRPVPEYDSRCPFRGLAPFRLDDREFFFGREPLLVELPKRLEMYPFLAILGASGSGKSSLVRAGLLPLLGGDCGEAICINPTSAPNTQLDVALAANPNCTALIVDQFEELFTLCHMETERKAFIERLLKLKESRKIILTMRADFLGECAPYTALKDEIEGRQEILAPLDTPSMRRVMEQQAAKVGLRFEGGLAEMILDDVNDEPGAMSLLQHALLRLWERRHGRWLLAKEYHAIGGVRKAIAQSANEVFATFDEADQERVRNIFLRLTRLDTATSTAPGQEHRDTRCRVEMRQLVPVGGDPEVITNLVARLADGRLVVTNVGRNSEQDEVEVAHEALIRHWPRLRGWLESNRAALRLREGILHAALDWEKSLDEHVNGREDLLLHRGSRLEEALALPKLHNITLNAQEQRYLDACVAMRDREREEERLNAEKEKRRSKFLLMFMAVVTGLMILLASISIISAVQAANSARISDMNKKLAEQAGTAQAHSLTTAEASRQEAVNSQSTAEASRQDAVYAKSTAVAALLEAEKGRNELIDSKNYAQEQAKEARSRELAAVSMAHQSDNIDLALLLAVEGWNKDPNFDTQNALLSGMMSSFYMDQIQPELTGTYPLLVYNQKGTRLAAGSTDGKVYLLDTANNKLVAVLESGAKQPVISLAFSPDGKRLASSDETGITLWDGASGERIAQLEAKDSPHIAFYDNVTLFAGADLSKFTVWDLSQTPKKLAPYYPVAPSRKVTSMVFSPKGQLAVGTERGAYLWLLERWKLDRDWVYLPINERVERLSFSAGGMTLAVSEAGQKSITLWDTAGNKKNRIYVNSNNVQFAFKPDDKNKAVLAYVAADNTIMLVDPLTGKALQPPMKGHVGPINALAFGPNGQLASDGEDRFILWNSQTEQQYTHSMEAPAPVRTFAISSDGVTLAVVDLENQIHFYPVSQLPGGQGKEQEPFKPGEAVRALALNQDGLLAVGTDDRVLLFDAQHNPIGTGLLTNWKAGQIFFSKDGKTLAASNPKDGLILVWDTAEQELIRKIETKPFSSFAIDRDGRFLVTTWEKGHVQVLEAESKQVLFDRFQVAHNASGDALDSEGIWADINPGGEFLFIHDYLGDVLRVFYVPTQQQVYELNGWAFKPGEQVVSPDGFLSVSRTDERTLRIMSLDPDTLKNFDCQKAGRNLTQAEWITFFPKEEYRKTCSQWDLGK